MNLLKNIGLALKVKRLFDAFEKGKKMDKGFDPKVTAGKVFKGLVLGGLAVAAQAAIPSVAAFLQDPTNVTAVLVGADVPSWVVVAVVPLVTAGGAGLLNWWKNRNKKSAEQG